MGRSIHTSHAKEAFTFGFFDKLCIELEKITFSNVNVKHDGNHIL